MFYLIHNRSTATSHWSESEHNESVCTNRLYFLQGSLEEILPFQWSWTSLQATLIVAVMFSFAGGRSISMTSCRIVVPRFGRAKFVFWLDGTSPCYRLVDGTELIPGFVVSHYLRIISCHQFGASTTKFMSKESCYRVWNELSFFNLTALCHQLPQFFYQKISKNCICESPALCSALFRTIFVVSKRERKNLRLETRQ